MAHIFFPYEYRVFISSKSEDYPLAEAVYNFLQENNIPAFLASKELQIIGEGEYSRVIDAAIDASEHMIVVASCKEYIMSKWVQYEWSVFSNDKKGNLRNGNLLTILASGLSIKDLPASLRHMQSFTYSEYKDSILNYVQNIQQDSDLDKTPSGFQHNSAQILETENISLYDIIQLKINDTHTPIIPLIGVPNVGKTMTLVRLTRYLVEHGFRVEPDRYFRPSYDTRYKEICDSFQEMVNSANAAKGTSFFDILMVNVLDPKGRKVCSIIDTPGEINRKDREEEMLPYVMTIFTAPNPKIWLYLLEPEMTFDRVGDIRKTIDVIRKYGTTKDTNIIVLNKIDLLQDIINPRDAYNVHILLENRYPEILIPLERKSLFDIFRRCFHVYKNPYIVPFQTGSFHVSDKFGLIYEPSNNYYPKHLWDTLYKILRRI